MNRFALAAALLAGLSGPVLAAKPEQTRDQYVAEVRAQLKKVGTDLDALEVRARKEGEQARVQIDAKLKELRAKKAAADKRADQASSAAGEGWKEIRADLDRALRDLKKAYRKAVAPPKTTRP